MPSPPEDLPHPLPIAILNPVPPYFPPPSAPPGITLHPIPPTTPSSDLPTLLSPYPLIITNREHTPFPAPLIHSLPHLRALLTTGRRNRAIDLDACKEAGVAVAGTGDEGGGAEACQKTAQHAWALILALVDNVPRDDARLRAGGGEEGAWHAAPLNTFLAGKTFGVVGLGRLGTATAKLAVAFGMRVVAWSPHLTQAVADERAVAAGLAAGTFEAVGKEELFGRADVVSLHLVLSPETRGVVGREELGAMKKGAVVVNTARAGLVEEEALWEVLVEGRIGGAGLDVWWEETVPGGSRWRAERWGEGGRARVVMTPHMGYMFEETVEAWWRETEGNVGRFLRGEELRNRLV